MGPMPRKGFIYAVSLVWVVIVLWFFHFGTDPYPPGGLARLLVDVLLLCLIAASAWGLGALLLRPLHLADDSPGEAPFFEIGAGLGALALAVFFISASGTLYRWAALMLLGAGALLLRKVRFTGQEAIAGAGRWSLGSLGLLSLSLLAGMMTLVCSLAPPEFYDALIYHLAVPDLYIRHHGMVPIPDNFYASYPANMGMLYALGLLLHGGELAQSIHWLCGALATGAIMATAIRHTDRTTALLGCALFSLTPGVMLAATWAIADLGVTLFATLCFAAVLNRWMGGGRRWVVAAGIFAGLALGTKYTSALVVLAPAAGAIALRPNGALFSRRTWRACLSDLALFGGIIALLVAPWLVRNAVYSGNPLAPYFSADQTSSADGPPGISEEIQRRLPRDAGLWGLAWHYLSAPWSVTMGRQGAAGYLGGRFLMLIPMLLLVRGLPRAALPLATISGIAFAGWALSSQVTRYLFPALPVLAMLAAMAARRLPRSIAVPALTWSFLYSVFLFLFLVETIGSYRVVTGAESREDYLSRRVSYYAAARFLEESTPPQAKVLLVGEGRGFYCPREYAANTPFDSPILDRYAASASGERDLIARLKADGFTHLLVSGPELERTRGIKADDLLQRYFPAGGPRLLFEQHDVRVYALPD